MITGQIVEQPATTHHPLMGNKLRIVAFIISSLGLGAYRAIDNAGESSQRNHSQFNDVVSNERVLMRVARVEEKVAFLSDTKIVH